MVRKWSTVPISLSYTTPTGTRRWSLIGHLGALFRRVHNKRTLLDTHFGIHTAGEGAGVVPRDAARGGGAGGDGAAARALALARAAGDAPRL
jgi:hypothetical protein